jgi:uncharacterized protein YndB with AHSA1/START domain
MLLNIASALSRPCASIQKGDFMTQPLMSRRNFSLHAASLFSVFGLMPRPLRAAAEEGEISHSAEAIHQEVVLKASRERVYAALTEAEQFRKISNGLDTQISKEPGGAFSLFGKAIAGRHIELIPGQRIVQAWRSNGWQEGHFSIARFELKDEAGQTRIVFDHTGFPKGQAEHLAGGWKQHYWEPLAQYFKS